ncbi:MAG: MaoC family dehydratase N-terminal domain-containing protein [Lachnospiraceae bacterium]|jgi:acyl dehydratase|nr:MaoC family dehydratase N-terminal domain-containing protein [Lachnospiraceae bacterium]
MPRRNVYTPEEQRILDHIAEIGDEIHGWQKDQPKRIANSESIINYNTWSDPWSPIWTDEAYARNSRWGGIVAYPLYVDRFDMMNYNLLLEGEPATRAMMCNHYGGQFTQYKQIYVGDEMRVFQKHPRLIETLEDDEEHEGPRAWGYIQRDCDIYNQRGELVANHKHCLDAVLYDKPRAQRYEMPPFKDHWYTDNQNKWMLDISDNEFRRGADTLYWEDVKVGEALGHTTLGAIRLWDMVSWFAVKEEEPLWPTRLYRERRGATFTNPYDNAQRFGIEWHFAADMSNLMANPRAVCFSDSCRNQLCRVATNWMGDDGMVVYHRNLHFMQTPHWDCMVGCGRVIGKRIEGGRYLVDLETWLYDMCRGNVTDAARCTVELPSRGDGAQGKASPAPADFEEALELPARDSLPVGTRVRLHAPKSMEWWPDEEYPLEGVEGTVFHKYLWREALGEFTSFVDVLLDPETSKNPLGIGNELTFRLDQVEVL